jgi:hypothetical protein
MRDFAKTLSFFGLILIGMGLFATFFPRSASLGKISRGYLPSEKEVFTLYFPLATCVLLSLLSDARFHSFR